MLMATPSVRDLATIVQKKHGGIVNHIVGSNKMVYFYDGGNGHPMKGCLNIPYIRDLPSVQLEYGNRPKDAIIFLKKYKELYRNIDGFITMTDRLAEHIKRLYGINVPHGIFRNYPSWHESPKQKAREIVYIDNSSVRPVGFGNTLNS